MTSQNTFQALKILVQTPDLASKKWVSTQYDSQVMNDTIQTGGDAAIVRVHGTQKALALTSDCTPRYVEADPFDGAKQAVVETYRNISCVGGKPLAITNCLNFGNPQKPEIMGQIVKSIKGITEACKALDYPVVSGNVSLYNETDGKAIQPTPAIGGVGLLKDLSKRCDIKFKAIGDVVFVLGKTTGHLNCSLYEREILKTESKKNPPKVDLKLEKEHSELVRHLIEDAVVNACHDVSDGGLLITLFEMCNGNLGVKIDDKFLKSGLDQNALLFGEDQGRYVICAPAAQADFLSHMAQDVGVDLFKVGEVVEDKIEIFGDSVTIKELQELNEKIFPEKFS
ncbi:MAG: purL [Rickettsiaceae bacterium]|jgi:phosphoribosylformylglycinamidine synthase|nr:purL [Rickettsiaceae bacterium]